MFKRFIFKRFYFGISTNPLMAILLLGPWLWRSSWLRQNQAKYHFLDCHSKLGNSFRFLRKKAKDIWFDRESIRIPFLTK